MESIKGEYFFFILCNCININEILGELLCEIMIFLYVKINVIFICEKIIYIK